MQRLKQSFKHDASPVLKISILGNTRAGGAFSACPYSFQADLILPFNPFGRENFFRGFFPFFCT
jgi:hypothetical protein